MNDHLDVRRSNEHAAYFARNARKARPVSGRRFILHLGRVMVQVARLDGRWKRSACWSSESGWYATVIRYPR
jgi:hypothetical protein